jgi:hypothetical protein
MLLMVFMAVTSCGSAELIAVSSLLTYDVYRTYINPAATGEQVRPSISFPFRLSQNLWKPLTVN